MTLSTSALSALKKLAATREALVTENAIRAESLGAYRAAMRDVPYADQIPFENWMAKQSSKEPGYAEGGSVNQDQMQATPESNSAMAALARMLGKADAFARKPFGYNNPPAQVISDLLGVPALQKTAERAGYGEPLTSGKGWTSRMHPETEEALLAAPQFASPLGKMAQLTKGLPVGASIKPKGGNWLTGSVEDALRGLKRPEVGNYDPPGTWVPDAPNDALNSWVDNQLTRYIKNEMATPEDPIRALAERGVLHTPMEAGWEAEGLAGYRRGAGFPAEGHAKSETAKNWELASDQSLYPRKSGDLIDQYGADNPWLTKVPPETQAYSIGDPNMPHGLGFTHLMDELHNATNPASGLPLDLQLKYSALNQVSVPQAVERVAKINEWRAAQKAKANLAKANNAATVLHKEYPENNPKGLKWVELKKSEQMPEGWTEASRNKKTGKATSWYDENGIVHKTHPGERELSVALKYEGDTMGHCVGKYCPDVAEGRSRIFSLRSAKGEPHVTIETTPSGALKYDRVDPEMGDRDLMDTMSDRMSPAQGRKFQNWLENDWDGGSLAESVTGTPFAKFLPPREDTNTFRITQIKGKANRKPNDEYLPYVQDFVKSGKWSDVGDLGNTGLYNTQDIFNPAAQEFLRSKGVDLKPYIDPEETARYKEMFKKPDPGFANGGMVDSTNQGYNPAHVDRLVNQLRTELFQ